MLFSPKAVAVAATLLLPLSLVSARANTREQIIAILYGL